MSGRATLPKVTAAQLRTLQCAEAGTLNYVHDWWAEGELPTRRRLRWDFIERLLDAGLIYRVPDEKHGRGRAELTDLGRQVLRSRRASVSPSEEGR